MAPIADDDPDKWDYTLHTKVKHGILTKYIEGWIRIAGRFRVMFYYDCFAGRGEYNREGESALELGSPIRVMQGMQRHSHKGIDFTCVAIEKNKNNYDNLLSVFARERTQFSDVTFEHYNSTFEEAVVTLKPILDSRRYYPLFFFIDPFGFKVPFALVSQLCHYEHSEVLVTFMSKNIARFLESNRHTGAIEQTLGSAYDPAIPDLDLEGRQDALIEIYKNNLRTHCYYVMSYKLKESDADLTIYHLVHGSNYFEAFKLMKDILYNQGAEGTFTFHGPKEITLGRGQARLDTPMEEISFKHWLLHECSGMRDTYWNIMKKTYDKTKFIQPHYRKAILELAEEKTIKLKGQGPKGGLKDDTIVIFPKNPEVQKALF